MVNKCHHIQERFQENSFGLFKFVYGVLIEFLFFPTFFGFGGSNTFIWGASEPVNPPFVMDPYHMKIVVSLAEINYKMYSK